MSNGLQGHCSGGVPKPMQDKMLSRGPAPHALGPGQCLLLFERSGVQIVNWGKIWIDNLYLRVAQFKWETGDVPSDFVLSVGRSHTVAAGPEHTYLTNLRIQGGIEVTTGGEKYIGGIMVADPTFISGEPNPGSPSSRPPPCAFAQCFQPSHAHCMHR